MFSEVVKRLGTLKNQLLVFVMLSSISMHAAAVPLSQDDLQWKAICGVIIHFTAVLYLLAFLAFYCFALLHLPSTEQELQFSRTAKKDLDAHPERGPRIKPAAPPGLQSDGKRMLS
jgi:hypothetical protein